MWHDIEQNTDEWLALRSDKPTSSNLAKIMANYGKAFGEPAKKYAVDIAVAQISGRCKSNSFTNDHMERGHEEESLAIMAYEAKYFCNVTNGGFFESDGFGDSPDGLVSTDGLVEVKSAIPSVHYNRIVKQTFDPAYKWQLVGHLRTSKRDWVDFISYCSSFPDDKNLYVHRSDRDDFKIEFNKVDERLAEFMELIDETKSNILNGNYSIT